MLAVNSLAAESHIWKNVRTVGASAVSPSWRTICLGPFVITIYYNNFLWDRALDKLLFSFSSIPLDFGSINYLKLKLTVQILAFFTIPKTMI